jgi:hypothetical protein
MAPLDLLLASASPSDNLENDLIYVDLIQTVPFGLHDKSPSSSP